MPPRGQLLALLQAVLLVGLGDGVGEIGGFLGFLAEDLDFDQAGVADGAQVHAALEQPHRFSAF